jgi:hypothetical protein
MSEFSSLLQCSELEASSTKGTILSSKSDIHVMACITLCHSLWWWHIPKQCVTPCHDNVSQDMNRHPKTCVIISRQCHPLPRGDISRHCVIISGQCHPLPWTDISKTLCHYLSTVSSLAMNRHLKTLCHYLKTVSPLARNRHIKTLCHARHQCKYSTSKIPINAYFHPGSFLPQSLTLQNAWQLYCIQYWHFNYCNNNFISAIL